MSTRMYEDLKDTLKQELRSLAKKELSKESLDTMYKLSETLKAIQTIMAMEQSEGGSSSESGYSRYMPMGGYAMNSYGNSMNSGGSYNRGSYEGSNNSGNSNRGSYDGGSYRGSYDGGSYDGNSNRGSYDGRRGRDGDSDGRYSENSSNRGYSRHNSKEAMVQKLSMMMNEASTEKEREAIMRCMEQLES